MRKSVTLLLVLAFLTASCLITIQPAKASENSWLTRPPMPKEESGLVAAVVNGKIYAIAANGANEEYNPATLTWTTKESIPTPRGKPGIAVHQNKIYVIGGANGFDPATGIPILCSVNEAYNPLTDTWETRRSMPTPRSGLDANVVNGKIYLIGGVKDPNTGEASNLTEVYDPATDTWTTKMPVPTPVFSYSSAVVENKIYVISGSTTGQGTTNLTQIYDPSTDTWSSGKPPLTPVADAAAGATTGMFAPKRIYLIGGRTAATGISLNQVYDPETDQWTWGASMPTPRFNLAVAVVNDTLYTLGGVSLGPLQGTIYAVNELYLPLGYEGPLPPYWSPPISPSSSSGNSTSPSLNISILSPENTTYAAIYDPYITVPLTFRTNEPISWVGYCLDGGNNVTVSANGTLIEIPAESRYLTLYANDTAGNWANPQTVYYEIAFNLGPVRPEPFPTTFVAAACGASVAIIGIGLFLYFTKRGRSRKP